MSRGRTQHCAGALKVKIADWDGLLVANLAAVDGADRSTAKASRPGMRRVTASVDAYALRIATVMESVPDRRWFNSDETAR
jgi:hypothetical protein